jgi:hypothetical protein
MAVYSTVDRRGPREMESRVTVTIRRQTGSRAGGDDADDVAHRAVLEPFGRLGT